MAADPLINYRSEFSESGRFINFASVGPLSDRAIRRLEEHVAILARPDREPVSDLLAAWSDAKELGARLLETDADHVTFVGSTSHGLFAAAFGLVGGNVVVPANEFPANLYPWIRAAEAGRIDLRQVPVPDGRLTAERIATALDRETVAVAVSAVGYATGYRADLAALRDVCGDALLVVDAVQALGALRVDMSTADLVVAGSQKWMRCGFGSGIAAVSDRFLDRYQPTLTGWTGVDDMFGPAPAPHPARPSAERLAMGSSPYMAVGAWRGSLEITLDAGVGAIEQAVLERAHRFEEAVAAAGVELLQPGRTDPEMSSIVSFRTPGADVAQVARRLTDDGFVITHRPGSDLIRVSPHATTPLATADALRASLGVAVRF
jgi:selenocysteine lyase/cysteine desulfurase